jgi:2-polyprenyl-6-hydroxyphenyl methylase/3-demethylubiquinone-9 3-methyltransferase
VESFLYTGAEEHNSHEYLFPVLIEILRKLQIQSHHTILDIGCGDGQVTKKISSYGFQVEGLDPSESGIELARKNSPKITFHLGKFQNTSFEESSFDFLYSLEVIEHVYDPHSFMLEAKRLLKPGGHIMLSTPYHSYVKNLAIALSGRFDEHFTALWPNGHIKFWSKETLSILINESGLEIVDFVRIGRVPTIAKSMCFVARKKISDDAE